MNTIILSLSGSLRAASINSMLLRAAAKLAPVGIEVSIFQGLGELPLFNPDLEAHPPANVIASIRRLRRQMHYSSPARDTRAQWRLTPRYLVI